MSMDNAKSQIDSKKRFSDRVADYVKYRPSYPYELINFLMEIKILTKESVIADVGSGTGLLTKLFLENGNKVFGVEPNDDMRKAGEIFLKNYSNYTSITGSSESTTLPDHSVDVITAGQAYHWFSQEKTSEEFKRILKDPNKSNIILVWNTRTKINSFNRDLEELIQKFSTDYNKVSHENDKKKDQNILFNKIFQKKTFPNDQKLTFHGLLGRLLSASYMLKKTDPKYSDFEKSLKDLFEKHQVDGKVTLLYETEVYYGSLK